jgi:hypothetical protein
MFFTVAGMTGVPHHTQLFSIEMGVSQMFLPELVWNHDLSYLSLPNSF